MKSVMKKVILALFATAALSAAPQLSYGFGIPSVAVGGGGDFDGFLNSADQANVLMKQSSWSLAKALLSKDKLDALKDRRLAIEKITDPKEKAAKTAEMEKDVNAELAKVDYAAKSKEMEKEHDKAKKENTAVGIYNFALGALKDTELVAQGTKLATTVPSPAIATKLPRVKEFVSNVSGQMDSITKVVSGLKQLAPAVGLKALPTKSSEAAKPATAD